MVGDAGARLLCPLLASRRDSRALRKLCLPGIQLFAAGAQALAGALAANTALTALDVSFNSISEPGAAALIDLLASNSSLTQLDARFSGGSTAQSRRIQ